MRISIKNLVFMAVAVPSQCAVITLVNDKNTGTEINVSSMTANGKTQPANIVIQPGQNNTLKSGQDSSVTEFTLEIFPYDKFKDAGLRWIITAPANGNDKITFTKATNQQMPTFSLPKGYSFKAMEQNRPTEEPSHIMRGGGQPQPANQQQPQGQPAQGQQPQNQPTQAPQGQPMQQGQQQTPAQPQQNAPGTPASPVGATQPPQMPPVAGAPVQPSSPPPAPGQGVKK